MMKNYDAVVIGGGVLGCFAARNLRRWNIRTLLIEAADDVCTGITRANSAIIYSGCDHRYGSLKAAMSVRMNAAFEQLSEELELSFSRCGSLMTACGPGSEAVLQKKLQQGLKNGVPGVRIVSREEALEMEPMLSGEITAALYAPTTGTTNPWQLGIAAYENALQNGCEAMLNTRVQAIHRDGNGYVIETDSDTIHCRAVLNCAGMQADKVQEMLFAPSVRILSDASDYIMLEKGIPAPKHIIMQETEDRGKGISAVPTVEGRLMLVSSPRPVNGMPYAADAQNLAKLQRAALRLLLGLKTEMAVRSFAAIRPNPYQVTLRNGEYIPDGSSIHGFAIENPAPGFYSLIGVKTPGLTCSNELGLYLAGCTAEYLDAQVNAGFNPRRKGIPAVHRMPFEGRAALASKEPAYGDVVCLCEDITRGEIMEAIHRGAASVDAVKRRVGTGMGRCQGSRCSRIIEEMLEGYRNGKL